MNNNREKSVVDFNQSIQTSSTSKLPLQMHNFMPMPTSTLNGNHQQREEARNSCFMNQLKQNMQSFWRERLTEICEAPSDVRGQHTLPIARIKKVMKSDEQVKMISADTPVVFAKACEMFIMELTLRAWMHTQENKRRTLQRNDVANAIRDEDLLVFLKDIVPMEIYQEAQLSLASHHGVYVPIPIRGTHMTPPIYSVNMQSMNQSEVAPEGRPMNLQYNTYPSFFTRNQEMQQNPRFPTPSPPANGANPYLGFKNFLQ